jgi:large subunit ribosomal protein L10
MRPEKKSMLDEIRGRRDKSSVVMLVNYTGLNVERSAALRAKLRVVKAEMHVVKNRLFAIAAEERGWKKIKEHLDGPIAMVTGDDELAVAKVLKDFSAEDKRPGIIAGVLRDEFLSADDIKVLANLPSREVMLAVFVGTVAAPMSRLVGALNGKLSSILNVLNAIERKKS